MQTGRVPLCALITLAIGCAMLSGCAIDVSGDDISIGVTVGAGLWLVANILYAKMRLEDEPSLLKRVTAFFIGFPTTFLLFLLVEPESSWIHKRLERITIEDDDPLTVQSDYERELVRIRAANARAPDASPEERLPWPDGDSGDEDPA